MKSRAHVSLSRVGATSGCRRRVGTAACSAAAGSAAGRNTPCARACGSSGGRRGAADGSTSRSPTAYGGRRSRFNAVTTSVSRSSRERRAPIVCRPRQSDRLARAATGEADAPCTRIARTSRFADGLTVFGSRTSLMAVFSSANSAYIRLSFVFSTSSLLQSPQLGDRGAGVLRSPLKVGRPADAVLTQDFGARKPRRPASGRRRSGSL